MGSICAIWAVQDKLALDADEEKAIASKRELMNGQEWMIWNLESTRMPNEKGNATLDITLPQQTYDRVKRLAEDGVQDLFPMPTKSQPTTAEDFVAELLIGRLRAFGITADSAEVQTPKT